MESLCLQTNNHLIPLTYIWDELAKHALKRETSGRYIKFDSIKLNLTTTQDEDEVSDFG